MTRRNFLTNSALAVCGISIVPSAVLANDKTVKPESKHRFFSISVTHSNLLLRHKMKFLPVF